MQIEINKKKYNCKFGIKFVRELDKKFSVKKEGVEFGFSLSTKLPELAGGNAATLSDFLYTATITESPRPSQDEIDDYIDNVENIEAVFDEVLKELEESNAGKLAVRTLKQNLAEQISLETEADEN